MVPWVRVELTRDQIPVVFETTAYTIPPPRQAYHIFLSQTPSESILPFYNMI